MKEEKTYILLCVLLWSFAAMCVLFINISHTRLMITFIVTRF